MIFGYLGLLLIVLFISKNKFGKWINIVSMFTGIWVIIAALSTFGIYDLRKPSNYIHWMSMTFILTTDIVMLLTMRGKKWRSFNQSKDNPNGGLIKSGVHFIQVVSLFLISILLFRSLQILLKTGSISAVRSEFYGEDYSGQYIFNFLFRQVPTGMIEGLIIYYTYVAFAYRKPRQLLYAVINVMIVTITSGGRYEIILFVLIIGMTFLIAGERIQHDALEWLRKYKRILFFLVTALSIVAVYITLRARNGGILKGLISYSSGSLSFLDYIMENPRLFGLNERLHGYMTFGAILEPIVLFLKFIGVTTVKTPSWYFNYHCQPFYNIATGAVRLYFNNNTSILYFLFYDFGFAGTIFGGIWMGGLISFFHNRMIKNDLRSSLLYIYFGSILLLTPMYYKFFNCNAIFTIFALYVCSMKIRIVIRRKAGKLL